MKPFFYFCALAILAFYNFNYQLQTNLQDMAYDKVDYALKHAVHDSALFVKADELINGNVVFDISLSEEAFKQTLQKNLPIDENFLPKDTLLLKDEIRVLEVVYIDDQFIDLECQH
ncbi:hypothetical protein LS684_10235 [Cytobacillus spongiae]|uniref:hypothetical protein n=1 Tax=Cytobacillus spongiae TaxID=2901381 RepID=UPI001F358551|nr:hypothetical protein [Cytobacillus spongiae]UII57767.1 hypothetical protein LS684_10235 [Cytobacillus spongiae]